jgi:hypothetical protein
VFASADSPLRQLSRPTSAAPLVAEVAVAQDA